MTGYFKKSAVEPPVSVEATRTYWAEQGFSFGVFRDPAGQEWNDFVHDTDEYVLVAEGTLQVRVGAEGSDVQAGDLVCIPKGVRHSLKTTSANGSVWFYGYGYWKANDD